MIKFVTLIHASQVAIAFCSLVICTSGCSTPSKISSDHLVSIGVSEGAMYWAAEQKLASEGYRCFVTGAKRENFNCTKTEGLFPTCILRVEFNVAEENTISHVRVADPACIGTP
jgi:hypothetical protein